MLTSVIVQVCRLLNDIPYYFNAITLAGAMFACNLNCNFNSIVSYFKEEKCTLVLFTRQCNMLNIMLYHNPSLYIFNFKKN